MISNNLPVNSASQLSSLPVVHIAPYLTDSDGHGRLSTSAALHAACREFGFFYLDLTGFATPEEMEELGRLAREFFALPSEEKNRIHLGLQDNARGASSDTLCPDVGPLCPIRGPDVVCPASSVMSSDLFK